MNLTNEQIEKAKKCETLDDLKAMVESEGVTLTDKELETFFRASRKALLADKDVDAVAGRKGSKNEPAPAAKFEVGQKVHCKYTFAGYDNSKKVADEGVIKSKKYDKYFKVWIYTIEVKGYPTKEFKESELSL